MELSLLTFNSNENVDDTLVVVNSDTFVAVNSDTFVAVSEF